MLMLSMMIVAPLTHAAEPTIMTDKPDYCPEETVTISGSGFLANTTVTVTITRPDSIIDTIYASTDESGAFSCTYQLNGITGTYNVVATDEANTATTTFTDTPPSYSVTISTVNGAWPPPAYVGNPVELTGTFSAHPGAGSEKQYGIQIGWGDGSYTVWRWSDTGNAIPYLTWNPLDGDAKTFSGTYNTNPGGGYPDRGHVYTTGGTKTITVKFFHGQPPGAESADATVTISQLVLVPEISVSKSGPANAHQGDLITYTITVSNPSSSTTMYKVSVIDSVLGSLTGSFSASLAPLASETKTFSYTVPTPSGDVTNTVTVTYKDILNDMKTASASWTVTVLHPGIQVTKTGPLYAHDGDIITYTVTVSNPSSTTTMYKVSVVDSLLGDRSGSFSASLAPLASESRAFTYTVPTPSGNILNTVTATYKDASSQLTTVSASWTVTVLHPGISVSKSGPAYAHEGDTITYTITVTNTGDCPLFSVFVTDTLLGSIYTGGLAFGATMTFTLTYTVPTPSGDISNTVTASGYDALGLGVSDTASWTVAVLHPGISVSKSGPAYAHEGDLITYTITVSNTGDCALYSVSVTDTVLGTIYSNGLAFGETKTFTLTYTVPSPSTVVSNTVTASGSDILGLGVSDSASWTVTVLHPGISVSKSGPAYAHEGDTITYTVTVSNPSTDTTMYKVSVVDSLLGDRSGSFSASLAPLASESRAFTYTVPTPSGDITNTVTVTYKNGLNQPKTAYASWTVAVLHPGISVSKSGPAYAHEGDLITYTITVSNTGDCALYSVSVTDTVLGTIYSNGLAFGETKTFTLTYTVPSPSTVVSNTVTASGSDILGLGVSDSASWTVTVLHPGISVSKSGPAYAHEGDTITYTITVSNTGDCALYSVFVTDTVLGPIYSNGLALGETKTFTLTYTVPISSGDISNTVTALGSDILGLGVSDSASWFVKVQYQITVTTSPAGAIGGTFEVTYTQSGTTYTDVPETTAWTEWVDSGTTVTVSSPQDHINDGPDARYRFDHYDPSASVSMTGSTTITLAYMLQYNITCYQTGVGSDFTDTVVVIDGTNYGVSALPASLWYDSGSLYSFAFQSPLLVGLGAKQYDWDSTTGLSSLQSGSITVTGSGSITGNYVTRVHDVAVTDIVITVRHCKWGLGGTWVFQGRQANISVTVINRGDFQEDVSTTLYYNITANRIIGTQDTTLLIGESKTLLFVWNTANVPYCHNYTITAVATIPADYAPVDNTRYDGNIKVRILGDLNGDGKVDMKDIRESAWSFASYGPDYLYPGSPPHPRWNLDCDINEDNKVDCKDLREVAKNFGMCAQ
jgi:uncharacterized repeat protein (TIGR01451 family)/fimbrial isopeptide formation D2 family protein